MQTILFTYSKAGISYSQSFDCRLLRGLYTPDWVQLWPPIVYTSIEYPCRTKTQFKGFRRGITTNVIVMPNSTDEEFIEQFLQANDKSIKNTGVGSPIEEVIVDTKDYDFENIWLNNCRYNKKYTIDLLETAVRTDWPIGVLPSENEVMYCKLHVKITGTLDSPELLTTNVGKLAVMEDGNSFPAISLLSWVPILHISSQQERQIVQVNNFTQIGSDIGIYVAMTDMGKYYGDVEIGGDCYADIGIILQART